MSEARHWAVLPAAGVGRRMGADIPKQYLELSGRRVIDHTIERMLRHPRIEGLCVAISEADVWWADSEYAAHPGVVVAPGGAARADSVLNALHALAVRAAPDDWVLVHDAARPCVHPEDISRLIDAVEQAGAVGGLLGMPVRDTMKRADSAGQVGHTVDRDGLWHAFTPQMFRLGALRQALGDALVAGVAVTDEASAMEWAGGRPLLVEGRPDNIKITRPGDLDLAAYYLGRGV